MRKMSAAADVPDIAGLVLDPAIAESREAADAAFGAAGVQYLELMRQVMPGAWVARVARPGREPARVAGIRAHAMELGPQDEAEGGYPLPAQVQVDQPAGCAARDVCCLPGCPGVEDRGGRGDQACLHSHRHRCGISWTRAVRWICVWASGRFVGRIGWCRRLRGRWSAWTASRSWMTAVCRRRSLTEQLARRMVATN